MPKGVLHRAGGAHKVCWLLRLATTCQTRQFSRAPKVSIFQSRPFHPFSAKTERSTDQLAATNHGLDQYSPFPRDICQGLQVQALCIGWPWPSERPCNYVVWICSLNNFVVSLSTVAVLRRKAAAKCPSSRPKTLRLGASEESLQLSLRIAWITFTASARGLSHLLSSGP